MERRHDVQRRVHVLLGQREEQLAVDEVRAWTIREGWKAPQAAGTIHTDFERGFIKAETYNYEDWVAAEMDVEGVKKAPLLRPEPVTRNP